MDIKLSKDVEQKLTASIQRYVAEAFVEDIGELKAQQFLRFCLEEIAPTVYNLAISDARGFLEEKTADLENVCFAQEFSYWNKGAGKGVSRKPSHRR